MQAIKTSCIHKSANSTLNHTAHSLYQLQEMQKFLRQVLQQQPLLFWDEIDRLASSRGITKSQMLRELLEEKLTERENERMEDAYDRLEKRLARMEERFAALMTKIGRAVAQDLYLIQGGLRFGHRSQEEYMNKHLDDSYVFAGKFLESKSKRKKKGEE